MKTFALLCVALAVLLVSHGAGQAQQRPKIGLMYPRTGAAAEYAAGVYDAFINGLGASANNVDVIILDTSAKPDLAVSNFAQLVQQDGVDLVVGPLFVSTGRAVAQVNRTVKVPLLMLTANSLENLAGDLDGNDWTVAFGSLPAVQEQAFQILLKTTSFSSVSQAVQVIGRGNVGKRLVNDLDRFASKGVSIMGPLEPTNERDLSAYVARDRAGVYVGISGRAYAERLYAALSQADSRKRSMLLFSPPPPVTRAWIAGRLINNYVNSTAQFDRDGFMSSLRSDERYDPDRRSLELFYSMTVYNATSGTQSYIGGSNAQQRGNRSGDSKTTETETCSCRDSDNKLKSCIDCQKGKCEKKKDGTDNCSTSCKS